MMNTKNDSVELKCYLDYLIAKYVAPQKENGNGSSVQYNVTESVITPPASSGAIKRMNLLLVQTPHFYAPFGANIAKRKDWREPILPFS